MFGRAVNAFKNSIIKSKSSSTLTNPDRDEDDNTCNESVVSSFSSFSIASCSGSRNRRSSATSTPTSRVSLLRRERRSHSTNREGEMFSLFFSVEDLRKSVLQSLGNFPSDFHPKPC